MKDKKNSNLYELFHRERNNHQNDDLTIFYNDIYNSMSYSNEKGTLHVLFFDGEGVDNRPDKTVAIAKWSNMGDNGKTRKIMEVSFDGSKYSLALDKDENGSALLDKIPDEFLKICKDYQNNDKGFYAILSRPVEKKNKIKYDIDR